MFTRAALLRTWRLRVFLFLLVVGVFVFPIYGFIHPQLALADRGVHTTGRVVALEPKQHQSIRYQYQVGGTEHSGVWGPWPLQGVHVGESIEVTYLPDSPEVSVSGAPVTKGWWFLPFVALPAVGLLAALFGVRDRAMRPPNPRLERP
jgi:hypothetical protein